MMRRPPFVSIFVVVFLFAMITMTREGAAAPVSNWRANLPRAPRNSDFARASEAEIELGRVLFFDKELSGNRNISCATCHSPLIGTVDGLSTNIGTGGEGLSVLRNAGTYPPSAFDPQARGARNMTPLFNLGHAEFTRLFWDGRVQVNPSVPQGFDSPAGELLPMGFETPLAALSIFAQTDIQEMLGQPGTNEMADAGVGSPHVGVWNALMSRLRLIPEYVQLFTAAFPDIAGRPTKMTVVHVGTALAAFQATAFRSDNSPFDQFLRGDSKALTARAKRGMRLFYGKAGCVGCHAGPFQTDHQFYAIGIPQVGPGFGDGVDGREDFGRESVTGDPVDRYRFRVPSLRNVELTGPWGHDGFYNSLEAVIRHHLNPVDALRGADPSQIVFPPRPDLDALDLIAFNDPEVTAAIESSIEIEPSRLSAGEVRALIAFMRALTDRSAMDMRTLVPTQVPSGLPLAEIR